MDLGLDFVVLLIINSFFFQEFKTSSAILGSELDYRLSSSNVKRETSNTSNSRLCWKYCVPHPSSCQHGIVFSSFILFLLNCCVLIRMCYIYSQIKVTRNR